MIKITDKEFSCISSYILLNYGINLDKKRYLIESKLWIELARCKANNYTDYWQCVLADRSGVLKQRMVDALTTNYSYFCREEGHFEFMRNRILGTVPPKSTLRIWCAGCATGQECYTLAMHLLDNQTMGYLKTDFEILGSDLSETAIVKARKGAYGSSDYARLPDYWQSRYCTGFDKGNFCVKDEVKRHVRFKNMNLMQSSGMMPVYQIVFCRNVLIYFKEREQFSVVDHLLEALIPGGYLFIGHTESIQNYPGPVNYIQPAIYQKAGDNAHG